MRRWVGFVVLIVVFAAALLWLSRPGYTQLTGEAFATHYRITYFDGLDADADTVQRAVDAELARIDAMASTWRDDSELMRYNRAERLENFALSAELTALIEHAKEMEAKTGGAFSLRPDGGSIDLSGIAKGYAVDRVMELLQDQFGVMQCLVDIGGEVRALGDGPDGDGWRVGLYVPTSAVGSDAPVLKLRDTSVATSGLYFKGNHILDPATGLPVDNDLVSASVIHPSNTTADALATAMYVMGPERGLAWAEENGIEAIFLLSDGTRLSSGISRR